MLLYVGAVIRAQYLFLSGYEITIDETGRCNYDHRMRNRILWCARRIYCSENGNAAAGFRFSHKYDTDTTQ